MKKVKTITILLLVALSASGCTIDYRAYRASSDIDKVNTQKTWTNNPSSKNP